MAPAGEQSLPPESEPPGPSTIIGITVTNPVAPPSPDAKTLPPNITSPAGEPKTQTISNDQGDVRMVGAKVPPL